MADGAFEEPSQTGQLGPEPFAWNWTTRPETKPHAGSPQEPAIAWRAPSAAPLCTTTADTTCTCTPTYGAIESVQTIGGTGSGRQPMPPAASSGRPADATGLQDRDDHPVRPSPAVPPQRTTGSDGPGGMSSTAVNVSKTRAATSGTKSEHACSTAAFGLAGPRPLPRTSTGRTSLRPCGSWTGRAGARLRRASNVAMLYAYSLLQPSTAARVRTVFPVLAVRHNLTLADQFRNWPEELRRCCP